MSNDMLQPKYCMELINRVESNPSFDNYNKFNGVDIWPIVRIQLMAQLTHPIRSRTNKKSAPLLERIRGAYKSLLSLILFDRKDILYFSDSKFEEINTKFINSVHLMDDKNDLTYVTFSGSIDALQATKSASLQLFSTMAQSIARLCALFNVCSAPRKFILSALRNIEVQDADLANILRSEALKSQIFKSIIVAGISFTLFKFFLKVVKPKKCFLVCYYSPLGMALCAACNQLGIEVSEIQHGVSGRYMRAYGSWLGLRGKLYNTLPKNYLCWTAEDAEAIEDWSINCNEKISAKIIGLDWLYLPSNVEGIRTDVAHEGQNKKVLVSCGGGSAIILALRDVINLHPDTDFVFRGHPDAFHEQRSAYTAYYSKVRNVHFESPDEVSIADSFFRVSAHVTEWSALSYAAAHYLVPTFVISKTGADYFENYPLTRYVDLNQLSNIIDALP